MGFAPLFQLPKIVFLEEVLPSLFYLLLPLLDSQSFVVPLDYLTWALCLTPGRKALIVLLPYLIGVIMDLSSILILASLLVGIVLGFVAAWRIASYRKELGFQKRLLEAREESVRMSRSTLTGKFSEQIAPYLPGFPYDPTEVRFLGSPVDFIVFNGLSQRSVKEIIFLEVKSGKAQLSHTERSLRDSVKSARIRWEEYRTPT